LDSAGREGLIHSDAFKDLQLLALGSLQVLENRYHEAFVEEKETHPSADPVQSVKEINSSLNAFLKQVEHVTPTTNIRPQGGVENLQLLAQDLHFRISTALPSLRNLSEQNIIYRGLATIGISAAVFGHETQTLIASFINSVDLLKLNLSSKHPDIQEAIAECEEAIRIAESIGSWGAFALARIQRDKRKRKKVDIRSTVADLLESLSPVFGGASVKITSDLEPVSASVYEMDVETILINLLTNAYNAVLQRNTNRVVDVTLSNVTSNEVPGIQISVGDSGHGVAAEFRERIWEPLFTTKDMSKRGRTGTGLGLSIVNSIVNDLGGTRSYERDTKLKGARFRIWLPSRRS
jgi:signal transduction histidine kinase